MTLYLCRYGEIFLKGQNRNQFEDALVRNIKLMAAQQNQEITVKKIHNRLLIESEEKELPFLTKVFGLVSYSSARKAALDWDELKKTAVNFMQELKFKTFKVNAQRQNKKFPLTSPEINRELGKYLEAKTKKEVEMHQPEIELGVEVEEDCIYLFTEKILSVGGLPVGCEGRVALLVEDEDSLRAGVLMMKRGCAVYPFALKCQKFSTSCELVAESKSTPDHGKFLSMLKNRHDAINNNKIPPVCNRRFLTEKDISSLQEYSPFPLELKIMKNIKEIEIWAEKEKVGVLVVGQRMENFKELKTEMVVLRPLIGE